jgi:hypothetical protein
VEPAAGGQEAERNQGVIGEKGGALKLLKWQAATGSLASDAMPWNEGTCGEVYRPSDREKIAEFSAQVGRPGLRKTYGGIRNAAEGVPYRSDARGDWGFRTIDRAAGPRARQRPLSFHPRNAR